MRPTNGKGKKGKGPAPRSCRKRPQQHVQMESDSEEDVEVDPQYVARDDESSVDSNSSWEVDTNVTMTAQEVKDIEDEEAIGEAIPVLDTDSEPDDDHTGLWAPEDLECLLFALNHYRPKLKGKFFGCAGGKARREKAWRDVADHVNERCSVRWSVAQCKGKSRRYADKVKHKYNALKRELYKTGGGEVDEDAYLNSLEESMLDYVGVDSVVGLKGMHGSRLKRHHGRKHWKRMREASKSAWDPEREDKRSYIRLETSKVKITKKVKAVKGAAAKKKGK